MNIRSAGACPRATSTVLFIGALTLATAGTACGGSAARVSASAQSAASTSAPALTGARGGTSPAPSQGFEFTGTITITGAVTVNTTFTQLHPAVAGGDVSATADPQTCAEAAVVGDANFGLGPSGDTWQVPSKISDITAPANVNVTVTSNRWKGPGTYDVGTLLGTSGVRINNATYYDMSTASAATLTVSPDGSGSLSFQGAPVSGQPSPTISGSVTWTCINHRS